MSDELAAATDLLAQANAGVAALSSLRGCVLRNELGRGGMGVVYLLERPDTGQKSALKLMLMADTLSDASRELFSREMRNAQTLSHPNVVSQYGSGAFNNTLFVVLEFCDGGSVADLIAARSGRLGT